MLGEQHTTREQRAWLLGQAIHTNDTELLDVFALGFKTEADFAAYLDQYFPNHRASDILHRRADLWTVGHFQALYVACWIYQPVEKGSFILALDARAQEIVRDAYRRLSWRMSSHLHGQFDAGSAGAGWSFLGGYNELLVQMESSERRNTRTELFLKCEGHRMWSFAHLSAWHTKRRTGAGNTANPQLHELAELHRYGILPRAAENFGKAYQKLLKRLGFGNKTVVTVQSVVAALQTQLPQWQAAPETLTIPEQIEHGQLAADLEELLDHARSLPSEDDPIVIALLRAESDIRGVIDTLLANTNSTSPQFYQEIRMSAQDLDATLEAFYTGLRGLQLL